MQYKLMLLSTAIMVIVIAVVTIIFLYVVTRFRRRKGEENKIPKQVEGSHTLEIIWTVIPIILLIILAVPTVLYTFKLADVKPMNKYAVICHIFRSDRLDERISALRATKHVIVAQIERTRNV